MREDTAIAIGQLLILAAGNIYRQQQIGQLQACINELEASEFYTEKLVDYRVDPTENISLTLKLLHKGNEARHLACRQFTDGLKAKYNLIHISNDAVYGKISDFTGVRSPSPIHDTIPVRLSQNNNATMFSLRLALHGNVFQLRDTDLAAKERQRQNLINSLNNTLKTILKNDGVEECKNCCQFLKNFKINPQMGTDITPLLEAVAIYRDFENNCLSLQSLGNESGTILTASEQASLRDVFVNLQTLLAIRKLSGGVSDANANKDFANNLELVLSDIKSKTGTEHAKKFLEELDNSARSLLSTQSIPAISILLNSPSYKDYAVEKASSRINSSAGAQLKK